MNNAKICISTAWKIKRRRGKVENMKVKEILKRYSAASTTKKIEIEICSGAAKGLHVIRIDEIDGLLERKAPITERTVGLIYVIDSELRMTAN